LIFIDSNIPMYLVGAPHPHKTDSRIILERLIADGQRLVTDVEVLQEILHRYTAIKKREAIGPAIHTTLDIADEIFPIEKADVMRAAEMVQHEKWLSARAAIHIAVMEHHGVSSILSFDADFDRWPGLKRIHRI